MPVQTAFSTPDVAFCPSCGSLLPVLPQAGDVRCVCCKRAVPIETFADAETRYEVVFHRRDDMEQRRKKGGDDEAKEGPTIERRCPACGHEKMSYATLQLRSADEGQTVFFTCLKCKFKESENS